jgi:hypothetical protein
MPSRRLAATAVLAAGLGLSALIPATAPAAPVKRCGSIAFTPQSDDGVFGIRAIGVGCRTARRVARASRPYGVGDEPYRYSARGFACRGTLRDTALPTVRWRCTREDSVVRFDRS